MLDILHYNDHLPLTPTTGENNSSAVVLLHGLFGSNDNLSVIRRHLQAQFRVVNIDLPDHGLSPRTENFAFENYAKLVINTLHNLGIKKANIIGHSLGGKVAMWIAYLQAELVDKLVILDIAPLPYEPRHKNVIDGLMAVSLEAIKTRKDAQQSMSTFIPDVNTQAFLLKSLYQEDGQWQWRFNLELLVRDYALLSDWSLGEQLVFGDEVLFIKGANSDYILPAHEASIKAQFPQAKAKIVKAGHWLHAEKPQLVNTLVTKHLLGA
jgi:esterase